MKGWSYGLGGKTRSEFLAMRRNYHPESFDVWAKKLKSLGPEMSREEVVEALRPKQVTDVSTRNVGRVVTIVLDDAYYAGIMFAPGKRGIIWVTPPIAISYEITPDGP
jgi:hypothetical protein